jgi:hypothetical protein
MVAIMENDFVDRADAAATPPSPAEARAALADLRAVDAGLAERVVTPAWYHPTLGAIVAAIVCTQAIGSPVRLVFLPMALFALPLLVVVYRRRYGVWVSGPAGPQSRRLQQVLLAVLLVVFGCALLIGLTPVDYSWVLLPAVIAFVAPIVLGRRYDDAMRRELASPGPGAA